LIRLKGLKIGHATEGSISASLSVARAAMGDERIIQRHDGIPEVSPETPENGNTINAGRLAHPVRLQSFTETTGAGETTSRPSSFVGFMMEGEGSATAAGADALGVGYGPEASRQSFALSEDTMVASQYPSGLAPQVSRSHPTEEVEGHQPAPKDAEGEGHGFEPIKPAQEEKSKRPGPEPLGSSRPVTEEDVRRYLSRRSSGRSGDGISRIPTQSDAEEQAEIKRLMSRMFGRTRQENSEEEKTRHVGVIFRNLTVKGEGLGAALQPTFGDVFLGLPRLIGKLFAKGPRRAAGKPPIKTIINDFSGVIKPGELCLVLGRPGSGCSTFLKVLGNQRFGYESIEGEVTYGGTDHAEMLKKYRGEVVYNPEDDLHYATLSVQATLNFALKCKTPGKESRNEGETARDYVGTFLRSVVKLFWIEHTLQTKVGNEYVRGVSGGERKRVSIAEVMITKASTQCWDNSTRGLDASTALEYVTALRTLTTMTHISTAVALYQAGESLYDCFDKVLLIDGGRCAYFGHASDAAAYFESLGFERPKRWTTADFLTSVTDEHERQIKEGYEDRVPRSADQFGDIFLQSEQHQRNLAEIAEFEQEVQVQIEERKRAQGKATRKKNYTIPFWRQVLACTHRQFLVMIGDRQSLYGKWGGILFQALIVGSLFYDLPKTSLGVFQRGGVLFFMLLFNALLALAELTAAFESRPILLKHKSFQFYRPAAYAIAQTVIDIPLVLVQVTIFAVVVYFMSNLQRTASQFFICLLFLFTLTMTMYAVFRAIGAWAGSLDNATRVTGVLIQALIVYTGYLIPPKKVSAPVQTHIRSKHASLASLSDTIVDGAVRNIKFQSLLGIAVAPLFLMGCPFLIIFAIDNTY
jgi:ATP-binding cassette, subfamily G (WHITE), member 2, SNQ2